MEVTRPNQVWAMDITYIPMARGFVYLAVVLDWFSRRVLSWRGSVNMEGAFCVVAAGEAFGSSRQPGDFLYADASQFPAEAHSRRRPATARARSLAAHSP